MTRSQDPAEPRLALDDLAHRSRRVLASWALKRDLRLTSAASIVWILAGPSLMFVAQTLLVVLGRAPLAVPLWGWALLAVAGPILYIAGRVVWLSPARRQDRRTCLGAYDRQLNSQDRLVTADEFVAQLGGPSVSLDARGATTDQFKIREASVPAYRLSARLFEASSVVLIISRAGEILRVVARPG